MPDIAVVLVEPKTGGNIGAVARAMKNFALNELRLVDSCDLGDEAEKRAMHARDVLNSARNFKSLEKALRGCSLIVGTSAIDSPGEHRFIRIPITPKELSEKVRAYDGKIAILFGREDYGLYNKELKLCDILVKIPTCDKYPVMNISHAATVVFYELYQSRAKKRTLSKIRSSEKEKLFEFFHEFLVLTKHPKHKIERTEVMFRRMVGRAVLSQWEYHILMGVIGDAVKRLRKSGFGVADGVSKKRKAKR